MISKATPTHHFKNWDQAQKTSINGLVVCTHGNLYTLQISWLWSYQNRRSNVITVGSGEKELRGGGDDGATEQKL